MNNSNFIAGIVINYEALNMKKKQISNIKGIRQKGI
jgi:hypothetical protein